MATNALLPLTLLLVLLGALVIVLLFRKPQLPPDVLVQNGAILEKLQKVEQIGAEFSGVKVELSKISERVSGVEQNHSHSTDTLTELSTMLTRTGATTDGLLQAAESIRAELSATKASVAEVQAITKNREAFEEKSAESLKRVEHILTGTQSKGAAGENIVDLAFAKLPAEWQIRNFSVGSKIVEFGIRLPNKLVLPIDSKWAGTAVFEEFLITQNAKERLAKKAQLQSTVSARASEVKKYIDPNVTTTFVLAAVPDPIFELCSELLPDLLKQNVVLVSYSMFIPYLLLVFHTSAKDFGKPDLKRLDAYLRTVDDSVKTLQSELEGRFSRALVMLDNSRAEMAAHLSKLNAGLVAVQIGSEALAEVAAR